MAAEPSPGKILSSTSSSCGVSVSRPANPNLRSSESTDPKRRSFVGSPFPRPSINTGGPRGGAGGGFHPNTPANSPSDYRLVRNSLGKENMGMASRDDNLRRENDTVEQFRKAGKVQSPAAAKGSKHFMSPTISAASKVNASPRKKVLVDKDEPIRTSISFSGGKLVPGMEKGLNQKKEVSFDSNVTYLGDDKEEAIQSDEDDLDSKLDISITEEEEDGDDLPSLLETEIGEKDLVNLGSSFELSTTPGDPTPLPASSLASGDVIPPLSPLDADPYMAPYDPKTNYLSPRPRFRHYKHNPRVELLKGRSGDLKEMFSAEGLSNAEATEDEETESLSSDVGSDDGSYKKEEEEVEDDLSESDHTSSSEEAESEVAAEVKKSVKQRVLTRTKFIAILFILASVVGLYLSLYSSSVMEPPSALNNLNFPELYVPSQLAKFSRESFEQVTQRIQPLLHHCISYLHYLILGFSQRHNTVALEYANLTSLLENSLVDDEANVFFSNSAFELAAKFEIGSSQPAADGDTNMVSVMGSSQHIEATEEVVQEEVHEQESEDQEEIEALGNLDLSVEHTSNEAEETNMAELVDNSSMEAALVVEEGQQDYSEHLVPDTFAQVEGISGDISATLGVLEANMDILAGTSELETITDHEESTETPQEKEILDGREPESEIDTSSAEIQDQPIMQIRETASAHDVAGITMLALIACLLAAIAMFYRIRTSRALPAADATLASQKATRMIEEKATQMIEEKDTPTAALIPIEQHSQQPILPTNSLTEVEYTGDEDMSASSMSHSQPAASSHRTGLNARGASQEAWSHEKRGQKDYSRRESSASSGGGYSMESKSYGSFTTYEKFPLKHNVSGEEQAVTTPVRRSSRLKNK